MRHSKFLLLATENKNGGADLSPRGDPADFIRLLDDQTILIPERPGNKIADSLTNLMENPVIAAILFIPGLPHTLTLYGKAKVTHSRDVLEPSSIQDKVPKAGIVIEVESVRLETNPGLVQMDLWNKDNYVDRSLFPSFGQIISDQFQSAKKMPGGDSFVGKALGKVAGTAMEAVINIDYKTNLY